MLRNLLIQNIALIERLEVEFAPGLTVITGETGAGKSIIVDALSLALGERANTTLIRSGAPKAIVEAEFDAEGSGALTAVHSIYALPEGVPCSREGSRGNADIHCSQDGRFVFATTRTDHAIVTFGVDPASGHLTLLSRCVGRWGR